MLQCLNQRHYVYVGHPVAPLFVISKCIRINNQLKIKFDCTFSIYKKTCKVCLQCASGLYTRGMDLLEVR